MNILVPLIYKDVFGQETPHDYFNFISKYPKNQLMARMSFLLGKSKKYLNAVFEDNSVKNHLEFLEIFELPVYVLQRIANCLEHFKGAYHIVYSRDTILYGMEEILQSNLIDGQINEEVDLEFKFSIFCYLLCLNDQHFKSGELVENFTVEQFNASILPANNVSEYNSITCYIKGVRLFEFLLQDLQYRTILREYIQAEFQCSVEQYIGFFLRWGESGTNIKIDEDQIEYQIFKKLSEPKQHETEIRKLTSLRISPIYHVSKNNFVILDKSFFLGKIYYQFIYEFWFNCVKKHQIPNKVYFKKIGEFFQEYSVILLRRLFDFAKHPVPLGLSELDYKTGKGSLEFADFYARENRKLVFAEIKTGNLNDNQRYAGNIEGLYAKGEKYFFDSLRQLEDSVNNLDILKRHFDSKIEVGRQLTIYPMCVLNDKIYDFGMMKIIFSDKWEEKRKGFADLNVKPLVILQIEELEALVYRLDVSSKNREVWDVFNAYCETKKGVRKFSLAKLDNLSYNYPEDIIKELQSYMDVYKTTLT